PACPPASSPLPLRPPSFLRPRPPPGPTLFPYTTLFRSLHRDRPERGCGVIERSGAEIDRSRRHAQHREQRGQPDRRLLGAHMPQDRKSTRLNSSHVKSSYAVFCLKKKTEAGGRPDRPHS